MIGAVITLPIEAVDRLCIVLHMQYYNEYTELDWRKMTVLIPGQISYWISKAYSYRHNNPMCYELLFGDEKAWFLGDLLIIGKKI